MSAITDRARDFWDRISPRERRLVVIAAIAAPITLAIWLSLSISDGLDAMELRNQHARKALDVLADLRARGQTHPKVDEAVVDMPTEPLDLDSYLTNQAKAAKFELTGTIVPHSKQAPHNGVVTNSSSLTVNKLSIEEVKDFMQAIETNNHDVAITHIELAPDFHDKDKLTLTLEVSAYSKAPVEKAQGSGSDAGSGSDKKGG